MTPPALCWRCGRVSTRMRVEQAGGRWAVTEWCLSCDCSAVRNRAWIQVQGVPDLMALPVKEPQDSYSEKGVCSVCNTRQMLECHHLAPRAQFGADADRWPTVMVCRPCHESWHLRMGQPINRTRA